MFNQFGHGINPYALDYRVVCDNNGDFTVNEATRSAAFGLADEVSSMGKEGQPRQSHLMNMTRLVRLD
jgi:hypothetical protein